MFRKIAFAIAFGAIAAPAFAGTDVIVNVGGLDASAAHAAIFRAAQAACQAALADESQLVRFYEHASCIDRSVTSADAKYAAMRGLASR